ncbi:hypothetical protein RJ640_016710 [Escallonia rubra]|uniref:Uncharacterized protein n=1 Tax=Escallonia rubra TaxID=112253 RepID=A0AA88QNU5_9ASTE|nr:hypothetical protein RJ640_016710 [Escallonia rubra]
MSVTASGFLFSLFLLLLFGLSGVRFGHAFGSNGTAAEAEMVPLIEPGKAEMVVMLNESRRRLGSFQICALYFMNGYFQRSGKQPGVGLWSMVVESGVVEVFERVSERG